MKQINYSTTLIAVVLCLMAFLSQAQDKTEKGRGTSSSEFVHWRICPLVLDGHRNEYDRSGCCVVIS